MGLDVFTKSGRLLLASSLLQAEVKHAAKKNAKIPGSEEAAKRAEVEPSRQAKLAELLELCALTRTDLVKMRKRSPKRYARCFDAATELERVAGEILDRFGLSWSEEELLVTDFWNPETDVRGGDSEGRLYLNLGEWDIPNRDETYRPELQLLRYLGIPFRGSYCAAVLHWEWTVLLH